MALAKPGDPYVTTNGKVLVTKDNKTEELDPIGNTVTNGADLARNHQSSARRSMQDLPSDPRTQTAIAVVLFYSLMGLSDNEISHHTGVSPSDLRKLKQMDAYQESYELLFWEFIHANGTSMQAKIAKAAPGALDSIISLAQGAENENARYKAAADILDRSGLHHETLFGKAASEGIDGLKIVVKNADDDKTEVNINLRR